MEQSIIDMLLVIDAETILSVYPPGTADNPTSIDQPLIFMMVRTDAVVFGQASKELKIKAQTEDVLRWRQSTASSNSIYSGLLYKFLCLKGDKLISPPNPILVTVQTPLPNPANPTVPGIQTIQNYFWQSTVLAAGSLTYAFYFMIVDRHNNVKGYYYWDPFITITA